MIKLSASGIDRVKACLSDIKEKGRTPLCPNWFGEGCLSGRNDSCNFCEACFLKSSFQIASEWVSIQRVCPCNLTRASVLIRRLEYILAYNQDRGK